MDAEPHSVTMQMKAVGSSEMPTWTLNIYGRENPKKPHLFLWEASRRWWGLVIIVGKTENYNNFPPGRDAQSHSIYLCLNIARWHTDLPPNSCTMFYIIIQSSYMFWFYIYIYTQWCKKNAFFQIIVTFFIFNIKKLC